MFPSVEVGSQALCILETKGIIFEAVFSLLTLTIQAD